MMDEEKKSPAGIIDSTLLRRDASEGEISRLCTDALEYGFRAVCVFPERVAQAWEIVNRSGTAVAAVVGFPRGTDPTPSLCRQAQQAVGDGADEIDMVMNLQPFLQGDYAAVTGYLATVVSAVKNAPRTSRRTGDPVVKVIIETAQLRSEEKVRCLERGALIKKASGLAAAAGADFVKTSTGTHPAGGVQPGDVTLIKSVIPPSMKVKAAGGIKTWDYTCRLMKEGADRIGTSSAIRIMTEFERAAGSGGCTS